MILYRGNPQRITLPNVRNVDGGSAIAGLQALTATLENRYGDRVGDLDSCLMVDVPGTPGSYYCDLPAEFNPRVGDYYIVFQCRDESFQFTCRQAVSVRDKDL